MKTLQQITETLVSFRVAELAKKKGFELNSTCYYEIYKEGPLRYKLFTEEDEEATYVNDKPDVRIAACTQDLLRKWLLQIHNIHITIFSKSQESWMYRITTKGQSLENVLYGEDFYSHDEAREEALFKALNLLQDEN